MTPVTPASTTTPNTEVPLESGPATSGGIWAALPLQATASPLTKAGGVLGRVVIGTAADANDASTAGG